MDEPAPAFHSLLRTDFASFLGKSFAETCPGTAFLPNWHLSLIGEYLEAARRGEITRLILNLPPRSLKSVCVSVAWPAWLLGHDPAARILAASYSQALALKHSLDCRQVITSAWYARAFPQVRLAHDQNEKHKFMTTRRGYRFAASVGGTLTGEGGNFLILDDPLNPAQAASRSARENANRWFDHTFASRLDDKKKGVMVLIQQRLHAEDLTGHLLAKGGWEHVSLPAIETAARTYSFGKVQKTRQPDEPLHEGREDADLLARAKRELGAHAFAAQYQQSPLPAEGALIRAHWLARYAAAPPAPQRIVQSWDTAIKSGHKNDFSCCLTFAEAEGAAHLLEALAFRAEYPDLKRKVVSQAERFHPHAVLMEDAASGQQLLQDLKRETALPLIGLRSRADKFTRAAAASAMIEAGRLKLPHEAPWLAEFEAELLAFPAGAHDDQVDALSQYLSWWRAGEGANPGLRGV